MTGKILIIYGSRRPILKVMYPIPQIKRAREYHLYDMSGKRYLDFYQEGGRALLGHRPDQLSLTIKNILGKGLLAGYPGVYEKRLANVLRGLLPAYAKITVFPDLADALVYLSEKKGKTLAKSDISEPVFGISSSVSWWRPFLNCDYPDTLIPCLPLPGLSGPVITAEKSSAAGFACYGVSQLVLGALSRIVYNLIGFCAGDPWAGKSFTAPGWSNTGPYLRFSGSEKEYRAVYDKGLKAGILFTPFYPSFSILPALYDQGELRAFFKGDSDA